MQEKLIKLMDERGIKRKKLAEIIHKSCHNTQLKVSGKLPFNLDEMFAIAKFFSLKLDDIFVERVFQNRNKKEKTNLSK